MTPVPRNWFDVDRKGLDKLINSTSKWTPVFHEHRDRRSLSCEQRRSFIFRAAKEDAPMTKTVQKHACPSCGGELFSSHVGAPLRCKICRWKLISRKEWKEMTPFRQGYALYMQGAWPASPPPWRKESVPEGYGQGAGISARPTAGSAQCAGQ